MARAGVPGWFHHRAGDGSADTGTCWRANNCTGNRTRGLTTGGGEWTVFSAPEAVEAIPELEFDQMANLTADGGHDRLVAEADADAEPIPKLEFDQTLGW